jgi:hypothetical protein
MPRIYHIREATTEATHYYLVPQRKLAIPKTGTARLVLNGILLNDHLDSTLPSGLADYPIVTRHQLVTMFPDYQPVRVEVEYLKYVNPHAVEPEPVINPKHLKLILSLKKD